MKKFSKTCKLPFLWIDFLGFSEGILNNSLKLDNMPDDLFNNVLPYEIRVPNGMFQYILISDTLVFCPGNKRPNNDNPIMQLQDIARIAHYMLGKSIQNKIPIRGTLGFGDILIKTAEGQSMALGSGVIDAYRFEKIQQWVGITLSNEGLRLLRKEYPDLDIEDICKGTLVKYDKIPINDKKTQAIHGYTINPYGDKNQLIKSLGDKMLESPFSTQEKYQNTIDYIKFLRKKKKQDKK